MYLVTAYIPINKISTHMNWLCLGRMHINRELSFVTLQKRSSIFQVNANHKINTIKKRANQLPTKEITETN